MKRKVFGLMIVASLVFILTGCMKIIKIGEEGKYTGKTEFNASDSVDELWDSAVEDISSRAVDLPTFITESNGDLKSLADEYGTYSMGTSGTLSYPVKGAGTVEEVENTKKAGYITINLDGYEGPEVIKLQIGSVYKGSSTRDSLTIINFGDYTNQEEWAAISKHLHEMIDVKVIQPADPSTLLGKDIEFVGTFTVDQNDEILITPVSLTVK
ncbi:MAG: DUF2291 domain-containing protein [Lachnospiraceae bacterium]